MKTKTIVIFFIILSTILSVYWYSDTMYRVLEVSDDCSLGIDFNHDSSVTEREYKNIEGILNYCTDENIIKSKYVDNKISENQKIYLKTKAHAFYKDNFYNKNIRLSESNSILVNNRNIADIVLSQGFAEASDKALNKFENISKIKEYLKEGLSKEYYILNSKNYTYHKLNCKFGKKLLKKVYIEKNDLPDNAKKCQYCFNVKSFDKRKPIYNEKYNSKLFEDKISSGNIEIINLIGNNFYKPTEKCNTRACFTLKNEIMKSKDTINIAVYDFRNQPELLKELVNAKNRGVKIRVVTDNSNSKANSETINNLNKFSDDVYQKRKNFHQNKGLMHNKFFIFDNKTVFTGSANITNTGLSGFNTNSVILIKSDEIAKLYLDEFLNLINNKSRTKTNKTYNNDLNIGKTKISIYFSPQDNIIFDQIIPEIKSAKKTIYVPTFILTHKELSKELINAKNRGVDVKVIIDATSARNKYSTHKELRKNTISVKTENFAGKMHMKTMIIDNKTVFIGSMNFTKSGNSYNDENCIKIVNSNIAKKLEKDFLYTWKAIPEKYLAKDPAAESFDSIGSCQDGIDNDFDGFIDVKDKGCQFYKPKKR